MKKVPEQFQDRVGYGLYGGVVQYYIKGVDGTVAELGYELPSSEKLQLRIESADRAHARLIREKFGK